MLFRYGFQSSFKAETSKARGICRRGSARLLSMIRRKLIAQNALRHNDVLTLWSDCIAAKPHDVTEKFYEIVAEVIASRDSLAILQLDY